MILREYEHAPGTTGPFQAAQSALLQLPILALGQQHALLNLQPSGLDSWHKHVTGRWVHVCTVSYACLMTR